jgi:hypothetical protein
MGKKLRSGSKILDPIFESSETIFGLKYFNSLMRIRDPKIFLTLDPGSGLEKFGPGSATLRLPTCTEDVDGDPGPRHEADGQAGQTTH